MYVKRNYGFWMTFKWSGKPFVLGLLYAFVISFLAHLFDVSFNLPWQPLSVIGIAVAFYLGFKNNSSYDRTWEARKIWGEIVNNSRSFGAAVCSFISGVSSDEIRKELIYRHIAWVTALRYQLRLSKEWEHTGFRLNKLFNATMCDAYIHELDAELMKFISREELATYSKSTNVATQIMRKQSERLQELRNQDHFEDFRHMEFHHLVSEFYNGQGKS
jgi:putative membrane protein